jgi:hypothetical protein
MRINVTALLAQQIADFYDCMLPTEKISDLIHLHAKNIITPCIESPSPQMGDTSYMKKHSKNIDKKLGSLKGLVSTVGKDWVLTNKIASKYDKAANYGWHDKNAPYGKNFKVWQPLSTVHNVYHTDYSQTLRLIRKDALLDYKDARLNEILMDDTLARMVSYEGRLYRLTY